MLLPDDLIEVVATVEGHPVRGIVDTGAKSNIISRELCENLNLTTNDENPHVVLITAGNEKLKPAKTVSCEIQFGNDAPYRTDLLVLDTFRYGLLFGWKFLSKIGAKISFLDNTITIGTYQCGLPDAFGVRNRDYVNCMSNDSENDEHEDRDNEKHVKEPDNQHDDKHEDDNNVRTALHEHRESDESENEKTSDGRNSGRFENTKSDSQKRLKGCNTSYQSNAYENGSTSAKTGMEILETQQPERLWLPGARNPEWHRLLWLKTLEWHRPPGVLIVARKPQRV